MESRERDEHSGSKLGPRPAFLQIYLSPKMNEDPMKKELQGIANSDTPEAVKVSSATTSLIIWAFGRFGTGAVFAYAAWMVYGDMKSIQDKVLQVFDSSIKAQLELKHSIESNTKVIEDLRYRNSIK